MVQYTSPEDATGGAVGGAFRAFSDATMGLTGGTGTLA